ncbi:hypothetical protein E4634_02615 [Mangrovimicrobium sediminis]|uniref:Uncharacterized protein n=1 Tax=Mangrovimicrobium sediminis TaxID=2562682 RepID=A0A4Z0M8Q2_9GAMM|nr:hypothetical protein [Haliea sp. SAOS-164]TGD75780.1 hypothetical protein E4634_02615 [Haliea sp. SAOS-164]
MRKILFPAVLLQCLLALPAAALSLAPEEFSASRQLACVLAEQSLGYLSEVEYGSRTHDVLDGFDEAERDNILSKALGYVDGLMFDIADDDALQVNDRLEQFVASRSCAEQGYQQATWQL